MPRMITALDPTPRIPNVSAVTWWSEFLPPWEARVVERLTDPLRTAELGRFDNRVRVNPGVPLQLAARTNTTVISGGQVFRVPVPDPAWVELRTTDDNWYCVDPVRGLYWEASKFGPVQLVRWLPSAWWNAYAFRVYDLRQRWDTQRQSITGGGLPMWPMVPRIEALDAGAGGVKHALHFVVSGGYSNEPAIPPARKSDGTRTDHPLRAGARLRLTFAAYDRLLAEANTKHDEALAWALRVYGAIVNDRTADVGHAIRMPLDPRLNITADLRLVDFEVLA